MSNSTELNPNLDLMSQDFLYHLGINIPDTKNTKEIQKQFGDVKVICMGGTGSRMFKLAKYIQNDVLGIKETTDPSDLCEIGGRYSMYKVGPVLCVSHGIGMSTFSVVLHEMLKLVRYAKCKDPVFVRIGTCGGVGVPPGTVVVTRNAYNGYLNNEYEIPILGNRVVRPAQFHPDVISMILECSSTEEDGFDTIEANTMATDCFYEGQGRLDGAVCHYDEKAKFEFLQKCYDKGIRNIEMEATMFSSLTKCVGVKAGDICVTLLNRLNGDQIEITPEMKKDFEQRPFVIVGRYIKKLLSQSLI